MYTTSYRCIPDKTFEKLKPQSWISEHLICCVLISTNYKELLRDKKTTKYPFQSTFVFRLLKYTMHIS